MIAVDTNVLVHSHRADSPFFTRADRAMRELVKTGAWAIPWPCLHEFLSVVTNPRIWKTPTPVPLALDAVEAWLAMPSLILLGETEGYWTELRNDIERAQIQGARVHDARIAALCVLHGVSELWTADRDFHAFPRLRVKNPLVS